MQRSFGLTKAVATLAVAGLLAGGLTLPARAAPPDAPQDAAAKAVDPAAIAALTRMSTYLSGLKSFELTADTTIEVVLRGGHQVEVGGTVHYWVKKPDRIRIDSETDMVSRQFFYDGKTFTLVAADEGYYAQTAGKPTIRETLAMAANGLNVEIPLADLIDWGSEHPPLKLFDRGFSVGPAKIGGVETEHYVLIGQGMDFEVWIAGGDKPLPLKMAIVDHKVPGSPRFTARLAWTPDATIADDTFVFTPAKDAVSVGFAKAQPAPQGGQGGK